MTKTRWVRMAGTLIALSLIAGGSVTVGIGEPSSTHSLLPSPLDEWVGQWEGEMTNLSAAGVSDPIPVTLRIRGLDDGSFEWRTVYGADTVNGLRDYRMIPDRADTTRYVIDEQNGIRLAARLLDGVLVAPFQVADQTLVSRYSLLGGGELQHEITFWRTEPTLTTHGEGPAGERGQPVASYEVAGVQRTVFRRTAP